VTDWTFIDKSRSRSYRITDSVDVAIKTPLVAPDLMGSLQRTKEAVWRENSSLKNLKVKVLYLENMERNDFDRLRKSKSHSYFRCSRLEYYFECPDSRASELYNSDKFE
jgi:hypothetical protein